MTSTVEIRGRDNTWHIYYPNEERLASPFPVYDREGNYKTTLWCGSDTNGMTEAHFEGGRDEAMAYALYLVPGANLSVTRVSTPAERLQAARAAKKEGK
jgi:hypothetical protein